MTRRSCTALGTEELLAYWLNEIDAAAAERGDEHLMACADCSARLGALVDLGAAVRRELERGSFFAVLAPAFIARLKAAGVRVREYEVAPGGSVDCTITRDDDLLVTHLHAPLRGVRRLDFVYEDPAAGLRLRANDVAFDPAADRVAVMSNAAYVRTLGHARLRMRLYAVDGVEERAIADYTFNHAPS
jgi:hypothetical protein